MPDLAPKPDLSEPVPPVVPVYLPTAPVKSPPPGPVAPATKVAFRSPPTLRRALELTRSLQRFKQVTRPGRPRIDIEASVQATADADQLMVVMTRPPVRSLDLALVVDSSSSMRVWDRTIDELQQILAQVGAFRTVSRWSLHLHGTATTTVYAWPTPEAASTRSDASSTRRGPGWSCW